MPVLHIPHLSAIITIITDITGQLTQHRSRRAVGNINTICESEDSLLDAQIRTLFKDDYARAKPHPHNYSKVLRAIEAYSHRSRKLTHISALHSVYAHCRQTVGMLYRAGLKPYVPRLVTGGVVVTLLMLAVGPQVSSILSGYGSYWGSHSVNYEMSSETDASQPLSLNPKAYQRKLQADLNQEKISADAVPATGKSAGWTRPNRQIRPVPDNPLSIQELEMKTGEDLHTYVPAEAPTLDPFEYRLINRAGSSGLRTDGERNQPAQSRPQ